MIDHSNFLAVHGFIFSWAFLPLIDVGERRAPLDYSPIGRSPLVAGINLLMSL